MDDLHNSAEKLKSEMGKLEQVMKQFSQFPKQLAELSKNAEHDPAAREKLENFHKALNGGLAQNFEKLKASAIELARAKNAYQNSLVGPNFEQALTEQLTAAIKLSPSNKALSPNKLHKTPNKKSKSRSYI